jgi:hypothetical protein
MSCEVDCLHCSRIVWTVNSAARSPAFSPPTPSDTMPRVRVSPLAVWIFSALDRSSKSVRLGEAPIWESDAYWTSTIPVVSISLVTERAFTTTSSSPPVEPTAFSFQRSFHAPIAGEFANRFMKFLHGDSVPRIFGKAPIDHKLVQHWWDIGTFF